MCQAPIPEIEYMDGEPHKLGAAIKELRTRAWWYYLRYQVANKKGLDDPHADDQVTLDWLKDEALDVNWVNVPTQHVQTATLQAAETRFPCSERVYFEGPDLSLLWPVIAGDDEGWAISRFADVCGLDVDEISFLEPQFFEVLLDICEEVAVHALAAVLSQLLQIWMHQKSRQEILHQFFHPNHYWVARLRSMGTLPEKADANMITDPWFKRAEVCLAHNSTIRRLGVYGLTRFDVLSATVPSTKQQARQSEKNVPYAFSIESRALVQPHTLPVEAMPPNWEGRYNPLRPWEKSRLADVNTVSIAECAEAWLRYRRIGAK